MTRVWIEDYAYLNTRLRALERQLLDRGWYERLLAEETLEGLVECLKGSVYADRLEIPGIRGTPFEDSVAIGAMLDEAFRRDLVDTFSKIRRMSYGRPRELLDALFLQWDAYNLKTIVRGKRVSASSEEILTSIFPVGSFMTPELAELVRAPTLQAIAEILATWRAPLASALGRGLKDLETSGTLHALECELDRAAFARAYQILRSGGEDDELARMYLDLVLEKTNILIILRLLAVPAAQPLPTFGGSPVQFLIMPGRRTRSRLEAILKAGNLREAAARLVRASGFRLTRESLDEEPLSLPRLERRLEGALVRRTAGLARGNPLGIGVAISYMEKKVNEVRNLRLIMRSKIMGTPDHLADWLVL